MSTGLSTRMTQLSRSPASALAARVTALRRQGQDIIPFHVGEPDFATPAHIKAAGIAAINENFTRYTTDNGILPLREEIARKLREENGIDCTSEEITVTVGAKQAVSAALSVIAGAGDEVLLPVPCWVSYAEMIRLAGAEPVFVPLRAESDALDLDAIRAAITPRTKAIVICTPNNPTGAVYSEASLRALAELAVRHDFFIVADEVYEKLVYGGAAHFSVASISPEVRARTVTVNGFSKSYAMTGWRVGYAAARADIIRGIIKVQSQTTSSCSAVSQRAALAALQGTQQPTEDMVREFARRRDYVLARLNAMQGITCRSADGAFYLFPDVRGCLGKHVGDRTVESSAELCEYLLDEALVAVLPGEAFHADARFRLAYVTSMDTLREGLDRLERALSRLE